MVSPDSGDEAGNRAGPAAKKAPAVEKQDQEATEKKDSKLLETGEWIYKLSICATDIGLKRILIQLYT